MAEYLGMETVKPSKPIKRGEVGIFPKTTLDQIIVDEESDQRLSDTVVQKSDIVDNLESTAIDLPLSANMGNSIQTRLNNLSTVIYESDGTNQRYFNSVEPWNDTISFLQFETLEFHIVFLMKNYVLLTSTNAGGSQCGVYFNCCHDDGNYRSIAGRFTIAGRYITNGVFQMFAIAQSNTSSVSVTNLDLSTITVNKIIGHNRLS